MGRLTRPRTHPSFLGLHACNKIDAWPMDGPILLHARAYLITRKKIPQTRETKNTQKNNKKSGAVDASMHPPLVFRAPHVL